MKKAFLFVLVIVLLTGCANMGDNIGEAEKTEIVCTIFPVYDWLGNIIGDNQDKFSLTLLGWGADIHSYQPTAEDIIRIQTCDLLIFVGGESDAWIRDVIEGKDVYSVSLMDMLREDLKRESLTHSHEDGLKGYDEHVWLSIDMAEEIVENLAEVICRLDYEKAAEYKRNAEGYDEKLERLDAEYERITEGLWKNTVIFADRFPFLYMMDDYDIEYFAAFPGCSSDTEASFETVAHLSEKAKELKKETLIVIENSKQNIAETIIENSDGVAKDTVVMNSFQSVDLKNSDGYIEIMRENLTSLKKALM